MPPIPAVRSAIPRLLALLVILPAPLIAQATPPASTQPKDSTVAAAAPAPTPAAPAPATPISVSGQIFASFGVTPSTTPNALNNQVDNAFVIDRAYLNFRAPVGEHLSVRVTTDVYQTSEPTPSAYTIRAKYALLQYDAPRGADGSGFMGRIGILQTVVIEHVETFWPRLFAQTAVERAGYFPASDVGLAGQYTLPNKLGEVYATITNGPSFAARERDRFKDYAARLSLTPLAGGEGSALLKSLTVTVWGYKGATASAYVNGGVGQVEAVGEALDRSRAGLFAGVRDPRLAIAGEVARSHDGREAGLNTTLSPRTLGGVTGQLVSAFAVVRPLAFTNGTGRSPFAVVARYDHVKPSVSSENLATPLSPDNTYHSVIAGVSYDVNPRVTVAADYDETLASSNGASSSPAAQGKGLFGRLSVAF